MKPENSAVELVQRQLDAYNARDLEAFAAGLIDTVWFFRPQENK